MKKLFYSLMTLAAALTVTSCLKEQPVSADPTQGGPTVDATFSLNLSQALTKAAADGSKATKLSYFFYDEKGNKIDALSQVNGAIPTEGKINVKLSRGVAYTFAAWAQADGAPYSISDDGKTVTMNTANLTANNDNYDAFYVNATITAEDTKTTVSKELGLTRPFAQVNVLVPNGNIASDYQTFKSSMTVKGVKTSMNLMDGTLTGDPTNVAFGEAVINETSIKDNHKYLAMNYVFAPAEPATFDVDFTVTPKEVTADAATASLKNVSLQRNRRTNLVGNIFKTQVDGTITITIGGNQWDTGVEEGISLPDVTVNTVAVGGSVPVAISGNSATTLTLNSNSNGAVTVDQPENNEVATTSYDSSTGIITVTPKGNGNTTFVAHIAAGETKAALRAVDITFEVTVTNYNGGDTQAPVQLEMGSVSCTNDGVNENTLTFSWAEVKNATGYMVSTDGTNYGAAQTALTYDLTGLEAGTQYTIHVKAIGDGTNYTDSDPVSASGTTKAAAQAPTTLAMSTITCSAQTANSLTFTWTAVENASGYKVSTDGGNTYGETINALTYTWNELNASTEYTLYVKAIGDGVSYNDSAPAAGTGTTKATVTIQYAGSTTTNMTGDNDAATVGLDAAKWSVVGTKGGSNNMPGLNKDHDIRLYWAESNSNTITVSSLVSGVMINSITITYTGSSYNKGKVLVGDNEVTILNGSYPINSSSFVITNGNTSNVQVRISSIVINYTPSN